MLRRRWIDRPRKRYGYDWMTGPTLRYHGARPFLFPMVLFYGLMRVIDLITSTAGHLRGAPWTIEARLDAIKREQLTWRVRGWAESRRALDEAATALERGYGVTSFGEPERSSY